MELSELNSMYHSELLPITNAVVDSELTTNLKEVFQYCCDFFNVTNKIEVSLKTLLAELL